MMNQSVNSYGEPVGGVVGFLKNLRYLVKNIIPSKVYIVWEQGGACPRRRKIYSEYKANRLKQKDFENLYTDENNKFYPILNVKNKTYQIKLLTTALNNLPVCQLYVPEVECDDVITYLCKNKFENLEEDKIIVSSDKDFYQLMENPKIKIYDLVTKKILTPQYVKEQFGISVRNITIARCLVGDNSDNIPGVPKLGFKTIAKRFPELGDDFNDYDIDWLLNKCRELNKGKNPPRCYKDIIENEEIIRRNWKLMFLGHSVLNLTQMQRIDYRLDNFKPIMNHVGYLKTFMAASIPITREIETVAADMKCLMF
jgi:5'-3' exonuclease